METKIVTLQVANHTTAQINASEADYWVLRRKLRRVQRDNSKLWRLFIAMAIIAGIAMVTVGIAAFKLHAVFEEITKIMN